MVIRVLYNNQDWRAKCTTPGKDNGCWRCFQGGLGIKQPDPNDKVCSGDCWERRLCTEYHWGCIPKGRTFGNRARPGTKVFLIFRQPGGKNYTLWGRTTVRSVDSEPVKEGQDYEKGFAFVHLEPFEPLPSEQWVRDLTDEQLVRAPWLMGLHRFIDAEQEAKLEQRIKGEGLLPDTDVAPRGTELTISVAPTMYGKLKNVETQEGRPLDEIVREAIAEWLRERRV